MLLIELVIVILFFSLSQVVLVQVFAGSQILTKENEDLNYAVLELQNLAEQLYAGADPEQTLLENGFEQEDGQYVYPVRRGIHLGVTLQQEEQPSGLLVEMILSAHLEKTELMTFSCVRYFPMEVQYEQ